MIWWARNERREPQSSLDRSHSATKHSTEKGRELVWKEVRISIGDSWDCLLGVRRWLKTLIAEFQTSVIYPFGVVYFGIGFRTQTISVPRRWEVEDSGDFFNIMQYTYRTNFRRSIQTEIGVGDTSTSYGAFFCFWFWRAAVVWRIQVERHAIGIGASYRCDRRDLEWLQSSLTQHAKSITWVMLVSHLQHWVKSFSIYMYDTENDAGRGSAEGLISGGDWRNGDEISCTGGIPNARVESEFIKETTWVGNLIGEGVSSIEIVSNIGLVWAIVTKSVRMTAGMKCIAKTVWPEFMVDSRKSVSNPWRDAKSIGFIRSSLAAM